ncbi:MAG: acyl carrier protein [Propionibacteriaceae bacterium]|jgi:acyl carrier protein|nr:acyl carrier protein [Propionibacteriaceae bacterium]
MSTQSSTFEQIKEALVFKLAVDPSEVFPESNLRGDLGVDSLDALEFVMALEDQADVSITEDEARELHTVQDVIDLLDAKQSSGVVS